MNVEKKIWGHTPDGEILLLTLRNRSMQVRVSNLGCTIVGIDVPHSGQLRNITLGYDSARDYLADRYYVGCIAGRYAGRIANARFVIDGTSYQLSANNGKHHLHGGFQGFSKKIFDVADHGSDGNVVFARFRYVSPAGDEGYPGTLHLDVTISLDDTNVIRIVYEARSDEDTVLNLTHHSYYNLSAGKNPPTQHELMIAAGRLVADDDEYIPTGQLPDVTGTRNDFRNPKRIASTEEEEASAKFDKCFVLDRPGDINNLQARLADPSSGISVDIRTTCPGIVFYSGDYLREPFSPCQGLCLETEFFPDSPHHKHFPSTLLRAGEEFYQETSLTITFP